MNTIIAKPNQSLLDVILTALGSLEYGMQFVYENEISLTTTVETGDSFVQPEDLIGDNDVISYLKKTGSVLGTKG